MKPIDQEAAAVSATLTPLIDQRMELAEALDGVLTAAFEAAEDAVPRPPAPPSGAELDARGLVAALRALVPGGAGPGGRAGAVASMAGVDRRTVQRIAAGQSKGTPGTLAKLRAAWDDQRRAIEAAGRKVWRAAKAKARQEVKARLTLPKGPLSITGRVVVSGDARPRTIEPGRNGIPASTRARIIDTWEAGDPDQAAGQLATAITVHYTAGLIVDNITEMTWT